MYVCVYARACMSVPVCMLACGRIGDGKAVGVRTDESVRAKVYVRWNRFRVMVLYSKGNIGDVHLRTHHYKNSVRSGSKAVKAN